MSSIIIRNGHIIDPKNDLEGEFDLLIKDGLIKEIGRNLEFDEDCCDVIDATGKVVCPGLIDFHVHCYEYATPLGRFYLIHDSFTFNKIYLVHPVGTILLLRR